MEDLNERALTRLANLFESAKDHGYSGAYVLNKLEHEIFNLPAGTLDGKFKVVVNSGMKEKEALDAARQVAMNKLQKGEIQGSQYLQLLDMESIVEMRKFFAESEEKMLKIAEANQNNAAQQQQQMQQMQQQFDMQMMQFDAQMNERLKQMEMGIEQRKLELEAQKTMMEDAVDKEKIQVDREKLQSEREIEEKYLAFQEKELAINAMNQQSQLTLQGIKNKLDFINSSRKKERIKD
jgi:hypothetical protein